MSRIRAEELWLGAPASTPRRAARVSASVGVAAYPARQDGGRPPRAADTAMYAAKRQGRDRVETAQLK
jgi:GGDEF domain-containing protein